MNSSNFVSSFRNSCVSVMVALDQAQALMNEYTDLTAAVVLDPHFTSTTVNPTDPIIKQDIIDAGAAIAAIIVTLGSGAASNRAKLNKVR